MSENDKKKKSSKLPELLFSLLTVAVLFAGYATFHQVLNHRLSNLNISEGTLKAELEESMGREIKGDETDSDTASTGITFYAIGDSIMAGYGNTDENDKEISISAFMADYFHGTDGGSVACSGAYISNVSEEYTPSTNEYTQINELINIYDRQGNNCILCDGGYNDCRLENESGIVSTQKSTAKDNLNALYSTRVLINSLIGMTGNTENNEDNVPIIFIIPVEDTLEYSGNYADFVVNQKAILDSYKDYGVSYIEAKDVLVTDDCFTDFVHPNKKGYTLLAKAIEKKLSFSSTISSE